MIVTPLETVTTLVVRFPTMGYVLIVVVCIAFALFLVDTIFRMYQKFKPKSKPEKKVETADKAVETDKEKSAEPSSKKE